MKLYIVTGKWLKDSRICPAEHIKEDITETRLECVASYFGGYASKIRNIIPRVEMNGIFAL